MCRSILIAQTPWFRVFALSAFRGSVWACCCSHGPCCWLGAGRAADRRATVGPVRVRRRHTGHNEVKETFAMPLVVVGSVALDTVVTPRETRENLMGGSAAYFSYAASYFTPVRLVSAVGEDWPPEYTELLRSRNIDTSGLTVVPGAKTLHWRGKYLEDMNQRETLDIQLNA